MGVSFSSNDVEAGDIPSCKKSSSSVKHNDVEAGDSAESTLVTCKIGYMTTPSGCKKIELGKPVLVTDHDGPGDFLVCKPGDFHAGRRGVVTFNDLQYVGQRPGKHHLQSNMAYESPLYELGNVTSNMQKKIKY